MMSRMSNLSGRERSSYITIECIQNENSLNGQNESKIIISISNNINIKMKMKIDNILYLFIINYIF